MEMGFSLFTYDANIDKNKNKHNVVHTCDEHKVTYNFGGQI